VSVGGWVGVCVCVVGFWGDFGVLVGRREGRSDLADVIGHVRE